MNAPHSTLAERLDGLQTNARQFADAQLADSEIRSFALGWWKGYPMFYWAAVSHEQESWRQPLLDWTNAVHQEAVKFLMRLAYANDLDGGALWETGQLCQQLFRHHQEWNVGDWTRSCPEWPECLDRKRFALSAAENQVIGDGERIFQRLFFLPTVARDIAGEPRAAVVTIPPELRKLIDQLPPDDTPGLRPAARRERLWLTWNTAEGLGPAGIRDRWNGFPDEIRKAISPRCFGTFPSDKQAGSNRVKQALIRARKDATTKPSRKPKTTRRTTPKQKSRKT